MMYFCVFQNFKFVEFRDCIDDCLFKIRNGCDINGNVQRFVFFEFFMDFGVFVVSVVKGVLFIVFLMVDVDVFMFNYRFQYLFQRVLEFCNEIKFVESVYLFVVEKRDFEVLLFFKSQQDIVFQNVFVEFKKFQ